jgi:hypothetical protein
MVHQQSTVCVLLFQNYPCCTFHDPTQKLGTTNIYVAVRLEAEAVAD